MLLLALPVTTCMTIDIYIRDEKDKLRDPEADSEIFILRDGV
jgi:hypothetical protein